MEDKVFKVTSKSDKTTTCYVAAQDYAKAVAKLSSKESFNFLYGSGFTIEETNVNFIW